MNVIKINFIEINKILSYITKSSFNKCPFLSEVPKYQQSIWEFVVVVLALCNSGNQQFELGPLGSSGLQFDTNGFWGSNDATWPEAWPRYRWPFSSPSVTVLFGAWSLGVFAFLPIFPTYFWKGENAEDVFVDLTWKCFFFSTSCFHRPFVRSNCAACHAPHPPPSPPSVEQSCVAVAGRHSLTFASFPALFKAARQTSRPFQSESVVQICVCICVERLVFVGTQSKGKWVIYSFLMKRETAVLQRRCEWMMPPPQATVKMFGVASVINAQHTTTGSFSHQHPPLPHGWI